MSFSKRVKEELSRHMPAARHCRIAELAGMLAMCAQRGVDAKGRVCLMITAENPLVAEKCGALLQRLRQNGAARQVSGTILTTGTDAVHQLLELVKIVPEQVLPPPAAVVVQNSCCKRAFLRGAFLAAGSISDPEKSYHLELTTDDAAHAAQLVGLLRVFSIDAKQMLRKRYNVVYIKEGSQIVDFLNLMEAHVALMEFENVRILKEMRNSINRKVNCETANIGKTVAASARQIDDIVLLRDTIGFEALRAGLKEIAELRLQYQEASLTELGRMLSPPLGRSGVNHRLNRLSQLANEIRGDESRSRSAH